jgi:hypothetical protein
MKPLASYRDTAGLDDFPEKDQLSLYRKAHRELLQKDPSYRQACRQFSVVICGLVLFPLIPEALRFFHLMPEKGYGLLSILIAAVSLSLLLLASSLAQHFRNISIAKVLKGKNHG